MFYLNVYYVSNVLSNYMTSNNTLFLSLSNVHVHHMNVCRCFKSDVLDNVLGMLKDGSWFI